MIWSESGEHDFIHLQLQKYAQPRYAQTYTQKSATVKSLTQRSAGKSLTPTRRRDTSGRACQRRLRCLRWVYFYLAEDLGTPKNEYYTGPSSRIYNIFCQP